MQGYKPSVRFISLFTLLLLFTVPVMAKTTQQATEKHSTAACIGACFGCGASLFLGDAVCKVWLECLDQDSAANVTAADQTRVAESAWLQEIDDCIVTPSSDLDACIGASTPESNAGQSWALGWDSHAGILSIQNTGSFADNAIVFVFDGNGVNLDLRTDQASVPIAAGDEVRVNLASLAGVDPLTFVVVSGDRPAKNGDGAAYLMTGKNQFRAVATQPTGPEKQPAASRQATPDIPLPSLPHPDVRPNH